MNHLNRLKHHTCAFIAIWCFLGAISSGEQPREIVNSIGMKLVFIPEGEFLMGAPPDEDGSREGETVHKVQIKKSFFLGATEVTQSQCLRIFPADNPSDFQGDKISIRHPQTGRIVQQIDTSDFPVENITWAGASIFCKRLSELPDEIAAGRTYRLPTEAEWEYACRAGSTTSFGDAQNNLEDYCWFRKSIGSESRTHKVALKKPNGWGLFDMQGNVREWCQEWQKKFDSDETVDSQKPWPMEQSDGRTKISRGGCWSSEATDCRCAARWGEDPSIQINEQGFRVVMTSSRPL